MVAVRREGADHDRPLCGSSIQLTNGRSWPEAVSQFRCSAHLSSRVSCAGHVVQAPVGGAQQDGADGQRGRRRWPVWLASTASCRGKIGRVAGVLYSVVTGDRVRRVGMLQRGDFLRIELQRQRRHRVMQMLRP